MNIERPVSTIMTTNLKIVNEKDSLMDVKELFDTYNIHHVPVADNKHIMGMISQYDLNHFIFGKARDRGDAFLESARLRSWKVGEVMTKNIECLKSSDPIRRALEIFRANRFHALPVLEDDELVGIVTTYDILDELLEQANLAEGFYDNPGHGKRSV